MTGPTHRPRFTGCLLVATALVVLLCGTCSVGLASVNANGAATGTDAVLVIADADSGDRLAEIAVEDGDEVTLAYVHSVEKTDVRDVYVVNGSTIEMTRTEFDAFGAGLPTDVERTDDGYVAYRDRSYERLYVSPGERTDHTLSVGEDRYDLYDLSGGDSVVLYVESVVSPPMEETGVR